jgi:hypothetical protein
VRYFLYMYECGGMERIRDRMNQTRVHIWKCDKTPMYNYHILMNFLRPYGSWL